MVENGNYTLRASPVLGVGGTYATSNGTFKIVTTAAQGPSSFGRQTWKVTAVEGKEDTYTIVLLHGHDISLGGSWSLKDNKADVPLGPIITTEEVIEWHITPTNNEIPNTYYIQPITKAVGASYYVGTNEDNQVVINVIPSVILPPFVKAYWQFL